MRWHMGATIYDGRGSVTIIEKKHKINVNISNEEQLIGAKNDMPEILWYRYFIEVQGFTIDKSMIFQDNLSDMLLKQNKMAPISE